MKRGVGLPPGWRRRGPGVVVATAVLATALAAATVSSTVGAAGNPSIDFNGDGFGDVVLAVPGEDLGGKIDAGTITIVYGSRAGANPNRSQTISQDGAVAGVSEPGDHFGRAFGVGDINGDGRSDLVVGAPNEAVGNIEAAGAITVVYGSSSGLDKSSSKSFTQGGQVAGVAETGDRFGASLALGDFDGDGYDDVVVGSPSEDGAGLVDSGAITVLYGSATGLAGARSQEIGQAGGVAGTAERDDRFGRAVAVGDFNGDGRDDVVVGIPGKDVGGQADAGAVAVLYGSPAGLATGGSAVFSQAGDVKGSPQGGDLFGAAVAAGDFNGDRRDDLAVGAPGEDVRGKVDAGQVHVLNGSSAGIRTAGNKVFSQRGKVNGRPQAGDRLGSSLATGYFDGNRRADLAVGVPGEDVRGKRDAGQVNVLYGTAKGLVAAGDRSFTQAGKVKGTANSHDRFGSSVQTTDINGDGRDDLIAGVPGEDISRAADAGLANIVYGSRRGLQVGGNQSLGQIGAVAGVAERGDGLGLASYSTWLDRVNLYRRQAGLDPVTERSNLSADAELHARYMVRNGVVAHTESSSKPGYTAAGNASAGRSNVYGTTAWASTDVEAVDGWVTGPFHAVGFLTPNLQEVGFGSHRDAGASYIRMAAGLDIWGAPRDWSKVPTTAYAWPGEGSVVPVRAHINEWPSPTTSCPNHSGLPVLAFFVNSVNVKSTSFTHNGSAMAHCVFDGTDYANPDAGARNLGRSILAGANAVVVMPRRPLTPGETYCFSVASRAETVDSCFTIDPNA